MDIKNRLFFSFALLLYCLPENMQAQFAPNPTRNFLQAFGAQVSTQAMDELWKPIDIDATLPNRDTPLMEACRNSKPGVVKWLLNKKANPNKRREDDGRTPLHIACDSYYENSEIVQVLLKNDADPNAQDTAGNTPLHVCIEHCYAVRNGDKKNQAIDMAKILITHPNTNLDLPNALDESSSPTRQTALIYATIKGNMRVVGMLLAANADPFIADAQEFDATDWARWSSEQAHAGQNVEVAQNFKAIQERIEEQQEKIKKGVAPKIFQDCIRFDTDPKTGEPCRFELPEVLARIISSYMPTAKYHITPTKKCSKLCDCNNRAKPRPAGAAAACAMQAPQKPVVAHAKK